MLKLLLGVLMLAGVAATLASTPAPVEAGRPS
jgi:hypothetical protein